MRGRREHVAWPATCRLPGVSDHTNGIPGKQVQKPK